MKWLENFTLLMRSSITTLREKVENPERMLHQVLMDMEEELAGVRESVAEAIADEIQLGKRLDATRKEAREWEERAAASLTRGDSTAARAALEQKVLADQRAASLDADHQKQRADTRKLERAVQDLEDKIRQARQKRTLLLARLTRADSETRIHRHLERAGSQSAFAQFGRLESKVERAEAKSEAYDRLEGRDPEAEELEREFKEKERRERLEAEFEELKRRVGKEEK